MRKTIQLHTEPHVVEVGDVELLFEPEVMGDAFVDAYAELAEAQKAKGVNLENLADADPGVLRKTLRSVRVFLARQMLPESAELFTRLDVVVGGKVVGSFHDLDEAEEFAAQHPGALIRDVLRLPTRVVAEILEWIVELYGGGGSRPTTSSSASAVGSRPAGMRGTAPSPSKASTRTRGR
ncbi:hypothetical protein ABT301_29625 [Streptomyces sp. NPDC000987]|uniref:hypothetical protein n=1 Tax=Streptomyces sp. NPDC000987 TaxID=3154374 RepID=UPI00332DA327